MSTLKSSARLCRIQRARKGIIYEYTVQSEQFVSESVRSCAEQGRGVFLSVFKNVSELMCAAVAPCVYISHRELHHMTPRSQKAIPMCATYDTATSCVVVCMVHTRPGQTESASCVIYSDSYKVISKMYNDNGSERMGALTIAPMRQKTRIKPSLRVAIA